MGLLTRVCPRELVDEVVARTGRKERRVRLLPARLTVYYVLALTLFFEDAYREVMRRLGNGLRALDVWRGEWKVPTTAALSQARKRLGEQPLRLLFHDIARPLAVPGTPGAWFRRWRVMALDSAVLDAPDTPPNTAEFGKPGNADGIGAYPQVRVVGLEECGTGAVVAAAMDSHAVGERELSARFLHAVEPDMLILADRGFHSYRTWSRLRATGADLLWRVDDEVELPATEWLPDGSYRAELLLGGHRHPVEEGGNSSPSDGTAIPVRVVEYAVTDRGDVTGTIRLITSIVDHDRARAGELAELYHRRRGSESAFDEIRTHQMPAGGLLRSRLPDLVRQEIWAMLLTHYAIRHFMTEAAGDSDEDVERPSFAHAVRVIRRQVHDQRFSRADHLRRPRHP